jgi:hypothetical protein
MSDFVARTAMIALLAFHLREAATKRTKVLTVTLSDSRNINTGS